MSGNVIIIVPSGGPGAKSFEAVAVTLKKEFYSGAKIVYATTVKSAGGLRTTYTHKGASFDWSTAHKLSRVITISHGGKDGPAFGHEEVSLFRERSLQPWGIDGSNGELSQEGLAFWGLVGKNMLGDGKIILLGCNMAAAAFGSNVSKAAKGKAVYASKDEFGAGDTRKVLPQIKKIEAKAK